MPAERAGLLGEIDALPGPMPRRRTAARGSARRGRSPAGIRPQQRTRVRLPMRLRLANCDCLEVGIIARFRHHIGRHAGGDWSFPRRLAPGTRLGEWLDRFRDDLRRSRGRTHDDARRRVGGRFASQTLVGRHTGYLLGARFRDYPCCFGRLLSPRLQQLSRVLQSDQPLRELHLACSGRADSAGRSASTRPVTTLAMLSGPLAALWGSLIL